MRPTYVDDYTSYRRRVEALSSETNRDCVAATLQARGGITGGLEIREREKICVAAANVNYTVKHSGAPQSRQLTGARPGLPSSS